MYLCVGDDSSGHCGDCAPPTQPSKKMALSHPGAKCVVMQWALTASGGALARVTRKMAVPRKMAANLVSMPNWSIPLVSIAQKVSSLRVQKTTRMVINFCKIFIMHYTLPPSMTTKYLIKIIIFFWENEVWGLHVHLQIAGCHTTGNNEQGCSRRQMLYPRADDTPSSTALCVVAIVSICGFADCA